MSEGSAQTEASAQTEEVKVDEEQQKRIQAFIRMSRFAAQVTLIPVLAIEVVGLFLFFDPLIRGIMHNFWLAFQPVPNWYPLRISTIFLTGALFLAVIFFPYMLVLNYLLPRHYKMHAIPFWQWVVLWVRVNGLFLLKLLLFAEILFLLLVTQLELWWLWLALGLSLLAFVRGYFAPLYAYRHVKRTPLTDERLVDMLDKLCKNNKTDVQHFFLLESRKADKLLPPNGFLAGWGKTSSILLSSGLIKYFPTEEIKVIIAHELGHHVQHHLLKKQALNLGLWLVEFFCYYMIYHWFKELILDQTNGVDFKSVVSIALIFAFAGLAVRLSCWMARRRYRQYHEYWADEFALRATRDVQAFKNSMVRLGRHNNNPFTLSPRQERGQTHPTTLSRLKHADEFAVRLAQARAERKPAKASTEKA